MAKATRKKEAKKSKNGCAYPLLSTTHTYSLMPFLGIEVLEGKEKDWYLEKWAFFSLHGSDNSSWRFSCYCGLEAKKANRDKESVCIFLSRFCSYMRKVQRIIHLSLLTGILSESIATSSLPTAGTRLSPEIFQSPSPKPSHPMAALQYLHNIYEWDLQNNFIPMPSLCHN